MASVNRDVDARALAKLLALVAAAVVVGVGTARSSQDQSATTGVIALGLAGAFWFRGRRDRTAPYVILPAVWFLAVAVAQLRILDYDRAWSSSMTTVAFGAPLLFAVASFLAAGTAKRPTRTVNHDALDPTRLLILATVLLAVGIAGSALKARLLGGIPILSHEIDASRSAGGIKVPFYITFLTDCAFISTWLSMLRVVALKRTHSKTSRLGIVMALAGIAVVSFGASRNSLIIVLGVPIVYAYLNGWTRRLTGKRIVGAGVVVALLAVVSSGLFFVRTGQHSESAFEKYFYTQIVAETPPVLQPLLPLYIGLDTPLETLNRVTTAFDDTPQERTGYYSLPGIPAQVNPLGAPAKFYDVTAQLSRPYYFNVATFAGAPFADAGVLGVTLATIVLGFGFGLMRRYLLSHPTPTKLAVSAYMTYLVAFLFYENLLGFYTLSVIWDTALVAIAVRICTKRRSPKHAMQPLRTSPRASQTSVA